MRIATLAIGTAVIGTVFLLGPMGAAKINAALGWPRWQSAISRFVGGALMVAGVAAALHCSQVFVRRGEGTPVPIEPPKRLVFSGLYRYSRNPMYVTDGLILFGLFLHRGELALLLYGLAFIGVAHAWIVWHEEPVLRARFGEAYVRYTKSVARWIVLR